MSPSEIINSYCIQMKKIGQTINKQSFNSSIGIGTSRTAYKISDTIILKIATIEAGVYQNINEVYSNSINQFSDILATIYKIDNKNKWIEMEYAKEATNKDFMDIKGINIVDFKKYMAYCSAICRKELVPDIDKSIIEMMNNNSFVQRVVKFMYYIDGMAGDLSSPWNWGVVSRNGVKNLVLIDYGITYETYYKYYNSNYAYRPTRMI